MLLDKSTASAHFNFEINPSVKHWILWFWMFVNYLGLPLIYNRLIFVTMVLTDVLALKLVLDHQQLPCWLDWNTDSTVSILSYIESHIKKDISSYKRKNFPRRKFGRSTTHCFLCIRKFVCFRGQRSMIIKEDRLHVYNIKHLFHVVSETSSLNDPGHIATCDRWWRLA